MVEEQDYLSILTGLKGCCSVYSLSEFTDYLNADLSSEELEYGRWVLWRRHSSSTSYEMELEDKIKSVLENIASNTDWTRWSRHLVQFWAPKIDGRHHYLTTSDQPFSVGDLCKGLCWYRKLCMDHWYFVEEGAREEQLGLVGRVYRNKRPESSPDLRLYWTNEFPLRDYAARCGLRRYLALPVFDLHNSQCYGVLEALTFHTINWEMDHFLPLDPGLQVAELRSTHTNFVPIYKYDSKFMPSKYKDQPESELSKMLELAIKAVPQLHLAQVWVPCKQCANMSNNLSCLERTAFIHAGGETVNSCRNIDHHMFNYLQACEFHNLQIQKGTVSYFHRNICDLSISENTMAHYAQKARLSFAVSFESVHNGNDLYIIEFFLHSNPREDACRGSLLHLLFKIMEMELKSYKFALGGQLAEELVVELSQPNAIHYKPTENAEEMEGCRESLSESDFQKYLQTDDVCCLRPSKMRQHGWVFCSPDRETLSEDDFNSNSSLVNNSIKGKIKIFMKKIASRWCLASYRAVQFWAPKMEDDRCYLATSEQPYAFGYLHKGLASYRKQCMKHHYLVDERTKDDELGPHGRVFRNAHLEITPDLRLYSTTEFSLGNHAKHCCLEKYFVLPVFNLHQHKCVGVLEFVGFGDYILEDIGEALTAANLSSTHISSKPSFLASHLPANITKCRKLALTEVKKALKLVSEIPQVYRAEVWVPYRGCASINSNLTCMELTWPTSVRSECGFSMRQIQVPIRKGIAGLVLASENKSCLFRDSCDFSIAEQSLAHYQQRQRLHACFAICLQSSHTGNLPYVLEIFLNKGPTKFGYLWSFLKFLLPIMKKNLQSFKVASGKQLGEQLVVDVIEFSEANEVTLSELNQPDISPIKFKVVQYSQKEHQHTHDQQVQYVSDASDSVRNVAQAKQSNTAASISKKEDAAKKTERGKRETGLNLNLEDLEQHFGKRLKDVAEEPGVGRSTIKRACREHGIRRWPCSEKHKNNPSLFKTETANKNGSDSQPNMCPSSSGNLLPSDMPLQQNVPQTNTESTQHLAVQAEAEKVIIKVRYEDDTIKFQFSLPSGMDKLLREVAMRLKLKMGSFKLKYLDEDNDEILLASDADLKFCPKSTSVVGKACIHLFVQLIHK